MLLLLLTRTILSSCNVLFLLSPSSKTLLKQIGKRAAVVERLRVPRVLVYYHSRILYTDNNNIIIAYNSVVVVDAAPAVADGTARRGVEIAAARGVTIAARSVRTADSAA